MTVESTLFTTRSVGDLYHKKVAIVSDDQLLNSKMALKEGLDGLVVLQTKRHFGCLHVRGNTRVVYDGMKTVGIKAKAEFLGKHYDLSEVVSGFCPTQEDPTTCPLRVIGVFDLRICSAIILYLVFI